MNYFIEGLQGSGKSTLAGRIVREDAGLTAYREGDYSPVELAWCAYVTPGQYREILERYPQLAEEIETKTAAEEGRRIIRYTQILTDVPGFHRDLERYEIYNGRWSREDFEEVVLKRFGRWSGDGGVFECSMFQNIVENQILFYSMTDEEIVEFYRRLKQVLGDRAYRIIYLEVGDIEKSITAIRKERVDEHGNELWFPLMLWYLENSPRGQADGLTGMEGLVKHLDHRQRLEKRILAEVFSENAVIVKAKEYELQEVMGRVEGQ